MRLGCGADSEQGLKILDPEPHARLDCIQTGNQPLAGDDFALIVIPDLSHDLELAENLGQRMACVRL
ncbi:hypothetical protein D3C85_1526840 [compost metagenome]